MGRATTSSRHDHFESEIFDLPEPWPMAGDRFAIRRWGGHGIVDGKPTQYGLVLILLEKSTVAEERRQEEGRKRVATTPMGSESNP